MIEYESKLIYVFADKLYKQAAQVVFSSAATGFIVGLVIGGAGDYLTSGGGRVSIGLFAIAGAAVGLFSGYAWGQNKTFALRLQAQTALCQVKIEENTRR